jgi:hypothetical protein
MVLDPSVLFFTYQEGNLLASELESFKLAIAAAWSFFAAYILIISI